MAGVGGYQPPSRPAAVSGPGRMSGRTDGGPGQPLRQLGNAAYGEQKAFQQAQAGARMAGQSGPAAAQAARPQMPPITGLGAPTERPDEPVTAGSPSGPGPGPESIGMSTTTKGQSKLDAQALASYLPALEAAANRPGVPPSFVKFVRYVRSMNA